MVSGSYVVTISLGVIPITIVYKYLFKEKNGFFHLIGIFLILVSIILVTIFEDFSLYNKQEGINIDGIGTQIKDFVDAKDKILALGFGFAASICLGIATLVVRYLKS